MGRLAVLVSLTLFLASCSMAPLAIKDEDTAGETTAKVFTRFVLGAATLGMSEMGIALDVQQEEMNQRFREDDRRFQVWWNQATPQERRDYQAHQYRLRESLAGALLNNALNPGPIFTMPPQPQYTPPPQPYTPPQTVNCTSNKIGDMVFTNCQDGTSVTKQEIGKFDYYNSNTPGLSGSSQQIGPNTYSQWDDGTTGTHQKLGQFQYDNFSDGTNCTTQTIGAFTYTNCH